MKFIPVLLLFFIVCTAEAQQFSQFNTGTLFDSFENPAHQAFIPDSSKQFAFNFFIPNLGATSGLKGNGYPTLRSYLANQTYNSAGLTYGSQNRNNINANFNAYWLMLKMYNRLDGNQEIGFSIQTKAEGRGSITDESLLLLDSYKYFNNGLANTDLFNDNFRAQAYHQISLTFRQKIAPAVDFGLKLSGLLGIYYSKLAIQHSAFSVTDNATQANLYLKGKYTSSNIDTFSKHDVLSFKNPGASVGFGIKAQLDNGIVVEGNIKDLGFIRWNKNSATINFDGTEDVNGIAVARKNDSRILTEADSIAHTTSRHSIYTPTDGKAELAASKKFNAFTADFYYTPTFIVSKSLFYNDFTAAFVNHFTYKSVWFTALASYNNNGIWNSGGQVMIKSPNAEFYIGTEQLFRSARLLNNSYAAYPTTGASIFLGFSVKFGRVIEHPANASYIPIGEPRGFFDKVWRNIFKPASSY